MSDAPDQDDILEQADRVHAAYQSGDAEVAAVMHRQLLEDHGAAAIAEAMADRDGRERLGVEVELLRLVGANTLYGRGEGQAQP